MRVRTAPVRLAHTRLLPAALAVATVLLAPARAAQSDPAPEPLAEKPFVIAMGPVDSAGDSREDIAAAIAIREDLPRRLANAAETPVSVVGYDAFRLAASTLSEATSVIAAPEAKAAAGVLGYDRLVLVSLRTTADSLSAHWQVYDPSAEGGTLSAGRLPGHPADLAGFVESLATQVARSMPCFDPTHLRRGVQTTITGWSRAYRDYYLARAVSTMGRVDEAITLLDEALELDAALVEARAARAVLSIPDVQRLVSQQDFQAAAPAARDALAPLEGWAPRVRRELLGLAQEAYAGAGLAPEARAVGFEYIEALLHTKDPSHALRVIPALIAQTGDDPRFAVLRSRAYRALGDWRSSEDALKLAQAQWPKVPELVAEQARLYRQWAGLVQGNGPEATADRTNWRSFAKQLFDKAYDIDRRGLAYRVELGVACFEAGDDKAAERHLASAVQSSTKLSLADRTTARATLARIRQARRDARGARALLLEATREALTLPLGPARGAELPATPPGCWLDLARAWQTIGDSQRGLYMLSLLKAYYGMVPEVRALEADLVPAPPAP